MLAPGYSRANAGEWSHEMPSLIAVALLPVTALAQTPQNRLATSSTLRDTSERSGLDDVIVTRDGPELDRRLSRTV